MNKIIVCAISAADLVTKCFFLGVTAYIEVRSNSENRFEGISKKMKALGATVSVWESVML